MQIPLRPNQLPEELISFSRRWGRNDHHITLIIPREVPDEVDEKHLIDQLEKVVRIIQPFPIVLTRVGFFGNYRIIYLAVNRSRQFGVCHDCLHFTCDWICGPDLGVLSYVPTPHITIASSTSPICGLKAWNEARQLPPNWQIQFPCKEIHLMTKGAENKDWTISAVFRLR